VWIWLSSAEFLVDAYLVLLRKLAHGQMVIQEQKVHKLAPLHKHKRKNVFPLNGALALEKGIEKLSSTKTFTSLSIHWILRLRKVIIIMRFEANS